MADSLLRNWCWQCNYKNRKLLVCQDYEDICNLGNKIPNLLVKSFFVCKFTFSLLGYCILCGVLAELCKDAALFFIVFCHIE